MRPVLIVVALALAAGPALADILPPGAKWARHAARFENLADFPDYAFFVWPRDLPRGHPGNSTVRPDAKGEVVISAFNPLSVGQAGGVFLFAVPKRLLGKPDEPPKEEWFEGMTGGVLKSPALARPIRTMAASDPRTEIVTRYRVAIKDGKLSVTEVTPAPTDSPAPAGKPPEDEGESPAVSGPRGAVAGGLAAAAVLSAGGLLLLRRRT